jgi:hypothetical protein
LLKYTRASAMTAAISFGAFWQALMIGGIEFSSSSSASPLAAATSIK